MRKIPYIELSLEESRPLLWPPKGLRPLDRQKVLYDLLTRQSDPEHVTLSLLGSVRSPPHHLRPGCVLISRGNHRSNGVEIAEQGDFGAANGAMSAPAASREGGIVQPASTGVEIACRRSHEAVLVFPSGDYHRSCSRCGLSFRYTTLVGFALETEGIESVLWKRVRETMISAILLDRVHKIGGPSVGVYIRRRMRDVTAHRAKTLPVNEPN